MAFVIDRVDSLGYLVSDARMRDPDTCTVVAHLDEATAHHLRETVPEGAGKPLCLAFWKPGYDFVVNGGASIQPRLAATA